MSATNSNSGTFIVIEGTDGSGKGTQFALLKERLTKEGYEVASFDFPQYDKPSSYFVTQYLNGKYGSADDVGPYTGSMFYALDRYEAAPAIRKALAAGKIVLANRFTGSNMAHQGTKFNHPEERRGYFIWLDNLEFEMLGIPRPQLNVVLRVPAKIAQGLVDKKSERSYTTKKRDIHEADLSHLQRAVEVYDDLCDLFPKDFVRIDCVRNDQLLSIEQVQALLWERLAPLLPVKVPAATVSSYYVPEELDETSAKQYQKVLAQIVANQQQIAERLGETTSAAQLARPVAASETQDLPTLAAPLQTIAKQQLPETYGDNHKPSISLASAAPRNEIDLVAHMLYEYGNVPLQQIQAEIKDWPYMERADIFQAYLQRPGKALQAARYEFDMLTSYAVFRRFQQLLPDATYEQQLLTPRYGYSVPAAIEEAGLTDPYEDCFDLSLQLFSQLQASGYDQAAQYACLLGHRLRWKLVCNAEQLIHLFTAKRVAKELRPFLKHIKVDIAQLHPLIAAKLN